MAASRVVRLIKGVWVEVTKDDIAPFRLVNEGNDSVLWVVDTTQPANDASTLERSVELTTDESMSRFTEMTPGRLYMMSNQSGTKIVMVD